jgi:hypothetical protein
LDTFAVPKPQNQWPPAQAILFLSRHLVRGSRVSNEESSSLAIRRQRQLLEHPEDFEDDNDNDNYSDYVENVSVHAGDSYQKWCAVASIYPN